jgi:hypothetical protein
MVGIYDDNSPETAGLEIMQQVHDDIKFQIDYRDPHHMVRCIRVIQRYLDPELHTAGRAFHIATDAKIGFAMDPMEEIEINGTDEQLLESIQEFLKTHEQAEIK